ncbi:MAG: hypothetical protein KKB30_00165 [Proteobacteria bacterium]|nr:hypothetical protein [Pseudomonadota bacterium]MBU1716569.1 hypothetical protein [Pseudomonadota bacterium]
MTKRLFAATFILLSLLLTLPESDATAARLQLQEIPAPLKPWVDWVLYDQQDNTCTFQYNEPRHFCAWPAKLRLNISDQNGSFSQKWVMETSGWVNLPGNDKYWPRQVELNERPATITTRAGRPSLFLPAGTHKINGSFTWSKQPEALQLPPQTGLLELTLNDQMVKFPEVDSQSILWLSPNSDNNHATDLAENKMEIRVYRHILDAIPLALTTRLELDVTGQPREVLLGWRLPTDYIPLSLSSPLPARLEEDGRLRVQVRPGRWTINFIARHQGPTDKIFFSENTGPWPETEIWVYEAQNHLRLTSIHGVDPIDPNQTTLPSQWRQLPTYLIKKGDTFQIIEQKRGDPDPAPDQLTLFRNIWLDEDGGGFTVQDNITGSITKQWRLEMNLPAILGRVAVDGRDQLITQKSGSSRTGVEIRRGQLNLTADSRTIRMSEMPAVGWNHDFQKVSAVLNLPAGWRLFDADGIDRVPTWLKNWTLLDLFLVLIIGLAVTRLWGLGRGVLALLTLLITYHEPGAPRWIWLNLLAASGLLRVLPKGRIASFTLTYRNLVLLCLAIIAIPFMVHQVRLGIYPQLEFNNFAPTTFQFSPSKMADQEMPQTADHMNQPAAVPEEQTFEMDMKSSNLLARQEAKISAPKGYYADSRSARSKSTALSQFDSKAMVQTGPGLPNWRWRSLPMNWNGPVEKNQQIHLTLIPPAINKLLCFLRVILLTGLALCFVNLRYQRGKGFSLKPPVAVITGITVLALLSTPTPLRAEMPSSELLSQLQERLLAPDECLPDCAAIPRMLLEVDDQEMVTRLEIHTMAEVSVPLPGTGRDWSTNQVLVDGKTAWSLQRDQQKILWLKLAKGQHQVLIKAPIPNRQTIQIDLPLKPNLIECKTPNWSVEGLNENGVADAQLQLTRQQNIDDPGAGIESGVLPPFVLVERIIHLGLDWSIETIISRRSPAGVPIIIEIPLLPGESVTSSHLRVTDNKVLINMGPDEWSADFNSVFAKSDNFTLTAPESINWTESWRLDISPLWHVESSGIPVIHHQDQSGHWQPQWRPWPGETVTFAVSRPEGVPGPTLTFDATSLIIKPGLRATDTEFNFTIRSSRGTQHTVMMPDAAKLQSVAINGQSQPIRQQGRGVTFPIKPGAQTINLSWRQSTILPLTLITPAVDLGVNSVNNSIKIQMPHDRWILFTGGPQMGPAVLFWGEVLVIIILGFLLGRIGLTTLKTHQWILLGLGLSQVDITISLLVVFWLLALGLRQKKGKQLNNKLFNLTQISLAALTLAAAFALFYAIQHGLLGEPNMQIAGNGSTAYNLNWYLDRTENILPQSWLFSVPLMYYRISMLLWAIWLAFALLRWLKWGWECFSTDGLWRHLSTAKKKETSQDKTKQPLPQLELEPDDDNPAKK